MSETSVLVFGVFGIYLVAMIVTVIVTWLRNNKKNSNCIDIFYLGNLANSDSSIKDAMTYLKITNSYIRIDGDLN